MKETEDPLINNRIRSLFLRYAIPGVIAMLFIALQTIADGFIVGRFLGPTALAGVNIAVPAYTIVTALALVIGVGSQAQLCLNLGKQDFRLAKTALVSGFIGLMTLTLVATILINMFAEPIAVLFGADEKLLPYTIDYIYGIMPWLVGIGSILFFDYILKGLGHPREAMCIMVLSIVMNVVLSYLFITCYDMGTFGAGLGTGFSFSAGAVLMMIFLLKEYRKNSSLKNVAGIFSFRSLAHILYNGSSEGITEIALGISTLLFNITLMKYIGSDGIAAFTIISYLIFIGGNVMFGISNGVIPILSYNYGAGEIGRVKQLIRFSCAANLLCGLIVFITLHNFSNPIVSLFFSEAEINVIEIATRGGEIVAYAFFFNALNIFMSSFFTAMDRGGISMLIAILRGLILLIPCIFILPNYFGIDGIWMTIPITEALTCIVALSFFFVWYCHNPIKQNKNNNHLV